MGSSIATHNQGAILDQINFGHFARLVVKAIMDSKGCQYFT